VVQDLLEQGGFRLIEGLSQSEPFGADMQFWQRYHGVRLTWDGEENRDSLQEQAGKTVMHVGMSSRPHRIRVVRAPSEI
jgi:hypothetical protein